MENYCSNVITIPQYTTTCWFNAILMSMLYSENSRKILLEKSKSWDVNNKIYSIFKEILTNKYIADKKDAKIFYDTVKPEVILLELKKINKDLFNFDPSIMSGFSSELYIKKLYKYLNASCMILDKFDDVYDSKSMSRTTNSQIYYSLVNNNRLMDDKKMKYIVKPKEIIFNKLNSTPDILCLNVKDKGRKIIPDYYELTNNANLNELNKLKSNIIFNDEEYILDSIILNNYNEIKINKGHSISGITCNNERYVYNGWIKSTIDPGMINNINESPCELMKYDWNPKKDNKFCISTKLCKVDNIIDANNLCFSFSKGERLLIYIKKSILNKKEYIAISKEDKLKGKIPKIKILRHNKKNYKKYHKSYEYKTKSSIKLIEPYVEPSKSSSKSSIKLIEPSKSSSKSSIKLIEPYVEPSKSSSKSSIKSIEPYVEPSKSSSKSSIKLIEPSKSSSKSSIKLIEPYIEPSKSSSKSSIKLIEPYVEPSKSSSKSSIKLIEPYVEPSKSSSKLSIKLIEPYVELSKKHLKKNKICPENKVVNPLTNRCIFKNGITAKRIFGCPDDKIRNPQTKRCINKEGYTAKKLGLNK